MTNKYLKDLSTQFKDKVVIITGSTQGSGAETAKLFAHRGAYGITICGRNEQQGLEIKSEIESIGSKCIFVKADLNEAEECLNIVKKTDSTFGKINSLINVAGFTERGTILSTTQDNYNRNFNINTKAPFLLMQESIKVMIREKIQGTILNVLSMAMYSGMPFLTAYSGSKAALAIITKNVANGVSGHRIRVNALNIGWTDTPGEDTIQKKFHEGGEDWLEKAESKVPFKRLTKPIDVARAAAYFCSEESGLVTGSIIDYDQTVNGWHSYSAYETSILDDSLLGE
jgi:NAD(P)-dependent dehydrogenase (short-subunit alcohol dehydrogenase family)|tara:strand:- start:8 stop:862 length:855 start_codon:yes stop_codon:yes gene_type:complete